MERPFRSCGKRAHDHEPTEEELDAIIAEQLPTMPPGNGEEREDNGRRKHRRREPSERTIKVYRIIRSKP